MLPSVCCLVWFSFCHGLVCVCHLTPLKNIFAAVQGEDGTKALDRSGAGACVHAWHAGVRITLRCRGCSEHFCLASCGNQDNKTYWFFSFFSLWEQTPTTHKRMGCPCFWPMSISRRSRRKNTTSGRATCGVPMVRGISSDAG